MNITVGSDTSFIFGLTASIVVGLLFAIVSAAFTESWTARFVIFLLGFFLTFLSLALLFTK